jgi:hypothetical protein
MMCGQDEWEKASEGGGRYRVNGLVGEELVCS